MAIAVNELKAKYAGRFEITEGKSGWLRIKELTPLPDEYPATQRPAFLDYNVEVADPRFSDTLDDRSRNVWLRNPQGMGFQHVSYCSGMGIWQVSGGIEPKPFEDLDARTREIVTKWLTAMDLYIVKSVPELEQLVKDRNKK